MCITSKLPFLNCMTLVLLIQVPSGKIKIGSLFGSSTCSFNLGKHIVILKLKSFSKIWYFYFDKFNFKMLTYFPFQNGRQISCKMAQCVYIKIRGFARGTCAQPQLGPWLRIFETKCALRRGIDFVDKFPSLPREIVPPSQGLILKLQYFIKKNIFFKYLHDPIENLYVTIPRKSQKIIKHMFTAYAKMLNPIYIYKIPA